MGLGIGSIFYMHALNNDRKPSLVVCLLSLWLSLLPLKLMSCPRLTWGGFYALLRRSIFEVAHSWN